MPAPLGAHISIAGGTSQAPARAKAIGATAMQIFTKMANRWADRECDDVTDRIMLERLRSYIGVNERSWHTEQRPSASHGGRHPERA